jgi:hypothetical protein
METNVKKFKRIDLKASESDELNLQKAAEKLGTNKVSKVIFESVKQVANHEPEVFFCNRVGIRDVDNNVNYGLVHLNKFIAEFQDVTGSKLTFEELSNLFEGLGKLGSEGIIQRAIRETVKTKLFQRLVNNHPDMTVTTDNIPDKDLTVLYELASEIDNMPLIEMREAGIFWNTYQLSENKIVVIPEAVEQIKNGYRKAASSPDEKKKLAQVRELCQVLNSFLNDPDVLPEHLLSVVYFDKESARFEPTGGYVKGSLRPNILFTR